MQRQLRGQYWRGRWHANQEGGGRSGRLTLIIKCSDKLFHGVNEDGEFSGFSFRGGSKGRSERKRTITCKCRHRSCSAIKDKACSVMDLFEGVWVIGEVIRKFELELVANLAPKLRWEGKGEGVARQFLAIRNVVMETKSLWYFPKSASDEIPVFKVSATNFSISAISQHCSTLEPGYSWQTALTNFSYGAVELANSGNISHSSAVSQSTNRRACPFISASLTTPDCANWNRRSSKKQRSPRGLARSNCGAPHSPRAGIGETKD